MSNSQQQRILAQMEAGLWYRASYFQSKECKDFIGYEAGPRLSELAKAGKVESRQSVEKGYERFKEYRLWTPPDIKPTKTLDEFMSERKTSLQPKLFNL